MRSLSRRKAGPLGLYQKVWQRKPVKAMQYRTITFSVTIKIPRPFRSLHRLLLIHSSKKRQAEFKRQIVETELHPGSVDWPELPPIPCPQGARIIREGGGRFAIR